MDNSYYEKNEKFMSHHESCGFIFAKATKTNLKHVSIQFQSEQTIYSFLLCRTLVNNLFHFLLSTVSTYRPPVYGSDLSAPIHILF